MSEAALEPLATAVLLTVRDDAARRPRAGFGGRVLRMALADFRERSRRYAFLITMVAGVWAAHVFLPPNHASYATLQIANHRGIYNSEWVGALVAMLANVFIGFAGFYLVKNAVDRDRQTRVGEVLAGAPMSRTLYTLSKALSNFLVLASMVLVLGASACVLQLMRGEDLALRPLAIALPLLVITLPCMALIASIAVLFETLPLMGGGLGNIAFFALWVGGLSSGMFGDQEGSRVSNDPGGLGLMVPDMVRACARAFPHEVINGSRMSMGISILDKGRHWDIVTFTWAGVAWTSSVLAQRAVWVALAIGIALIAAVPFDRFERSSSGGWRRWLRTLWAGGTPRLAPAGAPRGMTAGAFEPASAAPASPATTPASASATPARAAHPFVGPDSALAALAQRGAVRGSSIVAMVIAELRLALKGLPRMWWLVTLTLAILALTVPLAGARSVVAAIAWIWPILVWSPLGTRDARHGTQQLLASAPRPLDRQLPASWLAGVGVSLLAGLPLMVRFAMVGEWAAALTAIAGMLFVPAFALASGALTGNARLFEVLFLLLWYVGVLNRMPDLDISGGAVARGDVRVAIGFGLATLASLAIARLARARRLQD